MSWGEIPEWLGAISSIAIFFASLIFSKKANTIAKNSNYTQRAMLGLEDRIESAKKPLVHIWYNRHNIADGKTIGAFTMVNIGGSPLPIRTMRVLFGPEKQGQTTEIAAYTILEDKKARIGLRHTNQDITDLILQPNQLNFVEIVLQGSQCRFEVMYYDNSFEFLEIDTSDLGGRYILTGQGRKY